MNTVRYLDAKYNLINKYGQFRRRINEHYQSSTETPHIYIYICIIVYVE